MPADDNTKTPKKYSWSLKNGKMNCCVSEKSSCNVSKLWDVSALSPFHDAELQHALAETGVLDHVVADLVQAAHDFGRHGLGREQRVVGCRLETGNTGFRHGRRVGQQQ